MTPTPAELLAIWLVPRLSPAGAEWLAGRREELASSYTERALHITLGMVPRRLGKADLSLDDSELAAAAAARPGWDPSGWSVADAARVLVLLEATGNVPFAPRFTDLCRTADVGESVAFYRGLALYPEPASLEDQVAEGLRTNMRSVFEAIAHDNPYPRERFDESRWNQMVLKALFVGSTLHPIQGLDERSNRELALILCDYAHERWAAGRELSPELWRCVGPHASGAMVADLVRALGSGGAEREAAALALAASPDPAARDALAAEPDLARRIESAELSWNSLAGALA